MNIAWSDVAVDQTARVHDSERRGHVAQHAARFSPRERREATHARARQEFHQVVRHSAVERVVVDAHDARVCQLGQRAVFSLEERLGLGSGLLRLEPFQRVACAARLLEHLVNRRHPAAPEQSLDTVPIRNSCSWSEVSGGGHGRSFPPRSFYGSGRLDSGYCFELNAFYRCAPGPPIGDAGTLWWQRVRAAAQHGFIANNRPARGARVLQTRRTPPVRCEQSRVRKIRRPRSV